MIEYIGNEITYLLPGELLATASPVKISTILGSCVAVCLFDREKKIGGMNHYLLPYNKNNDPLRNRYGDTSLEDLLEQIIRIGAVKNHLKARVYGGSSMFGNEATGYNIGEQNVAIALDFLRKNNIKINAIETGGKKGRKIIFDTSAGVISSTFLRENHYE